jgi:hypothetical protein
VAGHNPVLFSGGIGDGPEVAPPQYLGLFGNAQGGDPSLRERVIGLYDELRAPLHGYLSCLGLKPQEAEDVIQDSFLKLLRAFAEGLRDDNLRGWVESTIPEMFAGSTRMPKESITASF